MAYQRGTIESYKMWADLVGDSSYEWDQLLPYFEKSLHFTPPNNDTRAANATARYDEAKIGTGGPISVTFSNYAQAFSSWVEKGLSEIGIKPRDGFTSGALLGSSYVLETIQAESQMRESSETGFLQPALTRSNLLVYTQSLATRVVFNNQKQATGVNVDTAGKKYTLSARKEVILSAGAFQSPQLLMVSGVGPAKTLRRYNIPVVADRPGVGQNMWDHIFFGPSYRVNVVTGSSMGNAQFAAKAAEDYANQTGILTNTGGDLFAWEKLPNATRASMPRKVLSDLNQFPPDWPEIEYLSVGGFLGDNSDYAAITPKDSYNYISVVAALVAPLSRGSVSISSNSMSDPPVIDPRWLEDPTDQAVAIAAYKRLRQLFATKSMAPVLIGSEYYPGNNGHQSDAELLSIIKKGYQTVWHASCTCKMGKTSDNMAVVDAHARVIGVSNLRVVDASSFAILPPGHPISTICECSQSLVTKSRD
jgi:choline dehydrogenase